MEISHPTSSSSAFHHVPEAVVGGALASVALDKGTYTTSWSTQKKSCGTDAQRSLTFPVPTPSSFMNTCVTPPSFSCSKNSQSLPLSTTQRHNLCLNVPLPQLCLQTGELHSLPHALPLRVHRVLLAGCVHRRQRLPLPWGAVHSPIPSHHCPPMQERRPRNTDCTFHVICVGR